MPWSMDSSIAVVSCASRCAKQRSNAPTKLYHIPTIGFVGNTGDSGLHSASGDRAPNCFFPRTLPGAGRLLRTPVTLQSNCSGFALRGTAAGANTVRKMVTQNQRRFNTILTCAFAPDMFYCQP